MAIPSGIIFAWPGAHATSHTGWSRETDLDDQYIFSIDSGTGGTTGGATEHEHTSIAHTHDVTGGAVSGLTNTDSATGTRGQPSSTTHTHVQSTSSTKDPAFNATNNAPKYHTVIWKVSAGTNDIPDDFIVWTDDGTIPTGWATYAANNRFLVGASAGADGGTSGGDDTHRHVVASHLHAYNTSGNSAGTGSPYQDTTSDNFAEHVHQHEVRLLFGGTGNSGTADMDPLYKKLLIIQNTSGGEKEAEDGMIGVWLGAAVDIPSPWQVYSLGDNDMVKCTTNTDLIGDTGEIGRAHV